ncbi:hypothetical protein K32_24060 [Kaistia sp. 32K]|uniref:prohead protease/major capsid protein fusion protein n=1 Tax=Kaistia sp. 32K TaxID=2795690 RepID=UPI0019156F73|nr:prohead protease/major capsid protein fusion protein [Kaistia sp. 32K]BCP53789.1 hypothetical protein K32_24060 [Kaistia sp. 32K]
MAELNIALPRQARAAQVRAQSFDDTDNTIEVVWTTGAQVQRYSWRDGPYIEELQVDEASVRLGRLNAGAAFLDTHDSWELAAVIGAVVPGTARIENGQGLARIKLSSAAGDADTVQKIRDGIIRNISVGYAIHRVQKNEADDGSVPVWLVTDWEPMEISAVPVPADAGSQIRGHRGEPELFPCVVETRATKPTPQPDPPAAPAANDGASPMTPEEIEQKRLADEAATRAAREKADKERAEAERLAAERAAAEAETARQAGITAERERSGEIRRLAVSQRLEAFGDEHVTKGTTVVEFRKLLLDKLAADSESRGPGNGNVRLIHDGDEKRGEAMQEALLHRFDPQKFKLTDAAREFRGLTLLEMGRDFLNARGVNTRGLSKMQVADAMLRHRSDMDIETRSGGMLSTSDFPNILANVANKTLRQGYDAAPQTFRPLVRVTTVSDFKPVSRTQLGEAPQLEKVNEHGEFKRGKMGDAAETYAISTYGKVIAITRQVIINDDLSAFTRIPRAFGISAANLESDLVWAIITANAPMADGKGLFHADHNNVDTAAAISAASVGSGRKILRNQKGLDGKTLLNITPTYIVGPTALETTIEQFLGQIVPTKSGDVVPATMKKLVPITEPRLDAVSTSNWFLAGDPALIDMIELAYLEGAEGLYTETRMGFDVDGVEVKVRQDVGAKAIDYRGFVRNGS